MTVRITNKKTAQNKCPIDTNCKQLEYSWEKSHRGHQCNQMTRTSKFHVQAETRLVKGSSLSKKERCDFTERKVERERQEL